MKKCIVDYARVKNVLLTDKICSPTRLNDCIRQDVYELLSNYMEIKKEEVEVRLNLEGGEPSVSIKAPFNRLKTFLSM